MMPVFQHFAKDTCTKTPVARVWSYALNVANFARGFIRFRRPDGKRGEAERD
jgi:hypothetical protein